MAENTNKNPENQINKKIALWRFYLLIGFVAAAIITVMGYILHTGNSIAATYGPLADAAMEIKLEVTAAHLWLEEIITGDHNESIDAVYQRLNNAQRYAETMIKGGQAPHGKLRPVNRKLVPLVDGIQAKLAEFRIITAQRYNKQKDSLPGSKIDQKYDAVFTEILNDTDQLEAEIRQIIGRQLRIFHVLQIILIFVCIPIAVFVGIAFSRFVHRQISDQLELQAVNQQFNAANQQFNAANQQFNAANQQLTASQQQLKALNQQLIADQQQLKALNQQLAADQQQLKALNQQLAADQQQLKALNQQLAADQQQLKALNQQLKAGEQQLRAINQQLHAANQQLRATEAELRKSRRRYRTMFESTINAIVVYDTGDNGNDFIIRNFNPSAERLEKTKKESVLGKNILDIFPRVRKSGLFDVLQKVWKAGKPEHYAETIRENGRIVEWRENYVFKISSGEIVVIYQDITGRKRAEEALAHSEAIYRKTIENTRGVPYELRFSDGKYNFIGSGIEQIMGVPAEKFTREIFHNQLVEQMIPAGSTTPVNITEYHEEIIKGKRTRHQADLCIRTPAGQIKWINDCSLPVTDEKTGEVVGTIGIVCDITERKQTEENLRESEEKFRSLAENSPNMIFINKKGSVVYANKKCQ